MRGPHEDMKTPNEDGFLEDAFDPEDGFPPKDAYQTRIHRRKGHWWLQTRRKNSWMVGSRVEGGAGEWTVGRRRNAASEADAASGGNVASGNATSCGVMWRGRAFLTRRGAKVVPHLRPP